MRFGFYAVIGFVFAIVFAMAVYMAKRLSKTKFTAYICNKRPKAAIWFSLSLLALPFLLLSLILSPINAMICFMFLFVFWVLCDFFAYIFSKIFKKSLGRGYVSLIAIGVTAVYLIYGYISAHTVVMTPYTIDTQKAVSPLKIAQISDSHIGALFDSEGFFSELEKINKQNPDLVVVTGDLVDDSTSREDMLGACKALGALKPRYGVYFVYGNHDKRYFSSPENDWDSKDLENALIQSGVKILEDEVARIGDDYYLIGRKDRSDRSRLEISELFEGLDPSKYAIVLDHQPTDYENEEKAGADLVLSGHTHGGQLFPINRAGEWLNINCMTYGHDKRGGTDFIVNSGIGAWEIEFKTGCISEYVMVTIK